MEECCEKIYNLYCYFVVERQNIFYKRLNGENLIISLKNVIYNGKEYSKEDVIKWMCEHQDEGLKRLGNRKLQYIDCQNLFCELDKYLRKVKPKLKSNRTNIKKKYVPKKDKIEYVYAPK